MYLVKIFVHLVVKITIKVCYVLVYFTTSKLCIYCYRAANCVE